MKAKWISVEDQPVPAHSVIVASLDGAVFGVRWKRHRNTMVLVAHGLIIDPNIITHWQPFPDPPEVSDES